MASTTITREQQVQVQIAIVERIAALTNLAKRNEELECYEYASELRKKIEDLKDAYNKSIHFDEWKALPWPRRED